MFDFGKKKGVSKHTHRGVFSAINPHGEKTAIREVGCGEKKTIREVGCGSFAGTKLGRWRVVGGSAADYLKGRNDKQGQQTKTIFPIKKKR